MARKKRNGNLQTFRFLGKHFKARTQQEARRRAFKYLHLKSLRERLVKAKLRKV